MRVVVPGAPVSTRSSGASSSRIVPVAVAADRTAPTGRRKVTPTVSSGSSRASPMTGTSRVCVVSPGAKVSVPVASTDAGPSSAPVRVGITRTV